MSTGFHPHTHLLALASEVTIKLFRSLTVFQSLLSTISRFSIHKRNFLEARVVIASYNDHCPAPFYPSLFGWLAPPKLTRASEPALSWNQFNSSSERADVKLIETSRNLSAKACFRQLQLSRSLTCRSRRPVE